MRHGAAVLLGLLVAVLAFLLFSAITSFTTWPWTVSQEVAGEAALGFEPGETKQECLERAIGLQRLARIGAVVPLDLAAPARGGPGFVGTALTPADLAQLAPADRWHVAIWDENAWLILEFEAERLARVSRKRYRGPTE